MSRPLSFNCMRCGIAVAPAVDLCGACSDVSALHNEIEDLRAELESWKRTCTKRDEKIERLEKEVAQDARAIRVLEERNAEHLRNYTAQLLLKDMANSRAAKHDQRAIDLQARLEASRSLVEKLCMDIEQRDEGLEATRLTLLKQIDDWKEDAAAWKASWRSVGKIRDQRTAERDMWKEEAVRAGAQVVEGNKLREQFELKRFEVNQRVFGKLSDEILLLEGQNRRLRAEHAAQLAESTEIARLKLKHHNDTQAWAANQAKITAALEEAWAAIYRKSREVIALWADKSDLATEIDHLEAQRAAWFSELSRLEKVEEESWGLRITVEEGQEIIECLQDANDFLASVRSAQGGMIRQLDHLIAALRDRIEELEEAVSRVLKAEEGEEDWEDLRYVRRWGQDLVVGMPFWSEKLRTRSPLEDVDRVWTVQWYAPGLYGRPWFPWMASVPCLSAEPS